MQSVTIDRRKRLRDEPHTGHNRWHPDIPALDILATILGEGHSSRLYKEVKQRSQIAHGIHASPLSSESFYLLHSWNRTAARALPVLR